ncbi:LysR family transcriptional regulator [Sphingomonas oryzagri]|uniref:LysR family transcriptional regulator n=1 Tax=Sphingomonas oryzagri TaxID=3042314 RepID=A0ABT6N079_9SPHN|nr:LysR family transcriptional regulator [Sphingomonas oryzagri]MDH7638647.1 LysR family transcriptional regulator [Sphingomonas oryzagri]
MSDLYQNLQTFARVAERRSFTAVAAESHASHTTIARRIDQLEAHFGVCLIHRSTRKLTLTAEGERLLNHAQRVVAEIANVEADLAGSTAIRGVVRVGVTTALGLHYTDRLAHLIDRHPGLRVEFAVADWQDSLIESGVDLALRVGDPAPEALGVEPLGLIERRLVASPAYLARRGVPAGVRDLTHHDCITYGYGAMPAVWDIDGDTQRVQGPFRANSSEAVHRAALGGLGIALLPHIQVAPAIAAGHLAIVLPDAVVAPLVLSIGHRFRAMGVPQRVRAVIGFLRDEFPRASHPLGKAPG